MIHGLYVPIPPPQPCAADICPDCGVPLTFLGFVDLPGGHLEAHFTCPSCERHGIYGPQEVPA